MVLHLGQIDISEAQAALMDVAERFSRERLDLEKTRQLMTEPAGFDAQDWSTLVALGWTGIAISESYGGSGLRIGDVVPVVEQMGRGLMAGPFLPTLLAAQLISLAGTEAQKSEYLPRVIKGAPATLALSEAADGYDLSAPIAQAKLEADGYKLSGEKRLVMHLDAAEIVIISAQLTNQTILFICEANKIPASASKADILIDETQRSHTLLFDGLTLPTSALMEVEQADVALQNLSLCAALFNAADCLGATKACMDETLDYLKTRKQFGRLIGAYQALKHPMVDIYTDYEKARSLLYAAAHSFDQEGGEASTRMAAIASSRALAFAADRAIQFHGGFGFTYDCNAHFYRRRGLFREAQSGDVRTHKKHLAALLF